MTESNERPLDQTGAPSGMELDYWKEKRDKDLLEEVNQLLDEISKGATPMDYTKAVPVREQNKHFTVSQPQDSTLFITAPHHHLQFLIQRIASYHNGWTKVNRVSQQIEIRFHNSEQANRFCEELEQVFNVRIEISNNYGKIGGTQNG